MSRLSFAIAMNVLFAVASATSAQALTAPTKPAPPAAPTLEWRSGPMMVFVVDGAGGDPVVADRLTDIADHKHLPVKVRSVPWCRQTEACKNVVDHGAQLTAAARLAETVRHLRKASPDCQVVFVGFSAGTRVVLAAAESSPPGSVDRIVLLGSTVSSYYDLRPALLASRGGIDSFFSAEDQVLCVMEKCCGTSDGQKTASAGRVGFQYPCDKKDCAAYAGLRQYAWTPEASGGGGHFYWTNPIFLCRMLTSLQCPPPVPR